MLVLKKIIDEKFQHLLNLLPSIYKPYGFIHVLKDLSEGPSDGPSDDPSGGKDFVRKMILNISNMTASQNIMKEKYDALTIKQCEVIKKVVQMSLAVFQENIDLEPRPNRISLPKKGGSITLIQAHVTNTELGHGSHKKKKRKLIFEDLHGRKECIL